MAYVDFSNAVIECVNKQAFNSAYFALQGGGGALFNNLFDDEGTKIANGNTPITEISEDGFKVIRTGTFISSGTEFYIAFNMGVGVIADELVWKVSNVLFNEGDSFSFEVNFKI